MNKSILSSIKELKPGEAAEFNISKLLCIRTYVCNINLMRGEKVLCSSINREKGVIVVRHK